MKGRKLGKMWRSFATRERGRRRGRWSLNVGLSRQQPERRRGGCSLALGVLILQRENTRILIISLSLS